MLKNQHSPKGEHQKKGTISIDNRTPDELSNVIEVDTEDRAIHNQLNYSSIGPKLPAVAIVHPTRQLSPSVSSQCLSDDLEFDEGGTPLLRRQQSNFEIALEDISLGEQELQQGGGHRHHSSRARKRNNSETGKERIPEERHKTFLAFFLLVLAGASNDLVLSFIHENVPDTEPLPDFVFMHTPYISWALPLSEYLMLISVITTITIAVLHCNRWIVLRRLALISSLLYFGRCLTLFVTQVPKADPTYYCAPKLKPDERVFWNIFKRAISVLVGLGMNINGRHTLCGDYIYSGHTIIHVICCLFICEYSPKKWCLLHYVSLFFSAAGIFCLLISRGHYSIDIIISYWITTRVFWLYHSLAAIPILRNSLDGRNHLIKEWWYSLFMFMEANIKRPLPRKYEWPIKRYHRFWSNYNESEFVRNNLTEELSV